MAVEPRKISQEEYNKKIANWGSKTGGIIKLQIRSLTSKGKGDLVRSLRMKTRKYYGEIERVTYQFIRHGVFWHKGVGRGYFMEGGTVMRGYKPGAVLKARALNSNRQASSRVLSGGKKRKPVEWFNPTLDTRVPALANMITEMRADQIVRATNIK